MSNDLMPHHHAQHNNRTGTKHWGEETFSAGWRFALRALRHRNYRLFFSGQSVSLIGTWMTRIATIWLVYRLTKSAFLLGLIGFSGQIPSLILGPIAGVWVDRWDRHRVLVITQVSSMIQSFLLAGLTLSGRITFWDIFVLSLLQGAINAFDMPARQAFVVEMLEARDDLPNAIALNSSMVNGSRLIGPALAGMVIAAVGEGYCFLLDGISYIAVIISLMLMHLDHVESRRGVEGVFSELKEGWQYIVDFIPIRNILLLLAFVSLMGMPYTTLMPIFAGKVLHGGPSMLGFLMAGYGMMQQMAASNTILQTIVEENKRGRVMSYYTIAFAGAAPFGNLIEGAAANWIGAPATLVIGGALCVLGALWFSRELPRVRAVVRPLYAQLGIIPEVATGLQTASVLQTPPE